MQRLNDSIEGGQNLVKTNELVTGQITCDRCTNLLRPSGLTILSRLDWRGRWGLGIFTDLKKQTGEGQTDTPFIVVLQATS